MSVNKSKSWFDDIKPPSRSSLDDTVGYLDTLIGGAGKSQRQFFPHGQKRENQKNNRLTKSAKKTEPQHQPQQQKQLLDLINVDDAQWLEQRKRRFPRITNDEDLSETDLLSVRSEERTDSVVLTQHPPMSSETTPSKGFEVQPQRRKKTLFEKLMEADG